MKKVRNELKVGIGAIVIWGMVFSGYVLQKDKGISTAQKKSVFKEIPGNEEKTAAKISAFMMIETDEGLRELLNINMATKEEFMSLEGVTEEIAEQIINYRTLRGGGFLTCDELLNADFITAETAEAIGDKITIRLEK